MTDIGDRKSLKQSFYKLMQVTGDIGMGMGRMSQQEKATIDAIVDARLKRKFILRPI